jgi:hypothetical protein
VEGGNKGRDTPSGMEGLHYDEPITSDNLINVFVICKYYDRVIILTLL